MIQQCFAAKRLQSRLAMIPSRPYGQWVFRLEPDLNCCLRGYIYKQSIHEMPSFYTLRNVSVPHRFKPLLLPICPDLYYLLYGKNIAQT